jgi:uridine phosphorylase
MCKFAKYNWKYIDKIFKKKIRLSNTIFYGVLTMLQNEFPILEFDEDKNAFIRPSNLIEPVNNIPEICVLGFFSEAIDKIISEYPYKIISGYKSEAINYPLYELDYKGKKIALIQAAVGAPLAAGQIDEISAMGCKKFIACGMCGVLQKDIAVGHLMIPVSAVRDEGTSYHYVKPSREITANERMVQVIENTLLEKKIPYIKVKTWTTDAFYRETSQKIAQRKNEGCVTVEMETSAYIAVSQYNNVEFGQILCSGDSLAGDEWDKRGYVKRTDIREFVLRLTLDVSLKM